MIGYRIVLGSSSSSSRVAVGQHQRLYLAR